ncbi:hypothetical protein [Rhizobium favelukesii]|uniref:hypothetical protein n=1 Tax=Rhizobium favelukesii TaxID=348824 RepID=UPI0013008F98|nr:hypothetical protein [Rhizobium favelukesii]MCS0463495.1 hypothetical protein [Rhizobium favelukesii]
MTTIKLRCDTADLEDYLSALFAASELLPEIRQGLVGLLDSGEELFCVHSDCIAASVTGELLVRFQPSDALLRLLSASGAWNVDFNIFEHATSPIDDSNVITAREASQ